MGISGLLRELGPPPRQSLAKLSSQHFTHHNNHPLKLAIDISIWLFQIQSGKGGSNPALRTFYYRLLRLLTLNIHPLFVFDGPNKPLFKRNKKVGGPGVRVASVPEFLAKQLLKHFGFPWHVAPGEAEAECALLQREGVVDAVLSEDVDTLMFGSKYTVRNWTSENSTKSPTHVDVYREEETRQRSRGLDRQGMVLVALMSGGDYLPEGIPGVGIKCACDAARAGFGRELCGMSRRELEGEGLREWKERLQREIRTNESKFFSRKNTALIIPEDFPSLEVLGYYTRPCVSTPEKLARLKQGLRWDQPIDFPALRTFTSDAFDWRCKGGAKKFIKNLAPAILTRELRLRGASNGDDTAKGDDFEAQEQEERNFVLAIHGTRNHSTTDGELEYRISFTPSNLVPINLDDEDDDDEFIPAGTAPLGPPTTYLDDSDAESEGPPPLTQDEGEAPTSPSKRRNFKPFDPSQPEKLWILKPFLQIGCPLLVEDYEASLRDPKQFLKMRKKARAIERGGGGGVAENIHAKPAPTNKKGLKKGGGETGMQQGALMGFGKVTKTVSGRDGGKERGALKDVCSNVGGKEKSATNANGTGVMPTAASRALFQLPSTQIPQEWLAEDDDPVPPPKRQSGTQQPAVEVLDLASPARKLQQPTTQRRASTENFFAAVAQPAKQPQSSITATATGPARSRSRDNEAQRTPKRNKKRSSADIATPTSTASQRTITSFYSPSPHQSRLQLGLTERSASSNDIINLISSSPAPGLSSPPASPSRSRPLTPSPPDTRHHFVREGNIVDAECGQGRLPDTVTKRRKREKDGLRRAWTAPVHGVDDEIGLTTPTSEGYSGVEAMDMFGDDYLGGGGFLIEDEDGDGDATPRARTEQRGVISNSPTALLQQDLVTPDSDNEDEDLPSLSKPNYGDSRSFSRNEAATASVDLPLRPSPQKPKANPKQVAATQSAVLRRSPRQVKKKQIALRESLEGWWKEIDAEVVDMSGTNTKNGAWKPRKGCKNPGGWRKSGVEVLDLTTT